MSDKSKQVSATMAIVSVLISIAAIVFTAGYKSGKIDGNTYRSESNLQAINKEREERIAQDALLQERIDTSRRRIEDTVRESESDLLDAIRQEATDIKADVRALLSLKHYQSMDPDQ